MTPGSAFPIPGGCRHHVRTFLRVLSDQRLQNLAARVAAEAYFAATFLGQELKLRLMIGESAFYVSAFFFCCAVRPQWCRFSNARRETGDGSERLVHRKSCFTSEKD
jgi:hypothetical protein